MATLNAYEILGVNRLATSDEIKEKFRVLMLQKHPDKQFSSSTIISSIEISSADQIERLIQARNLLLDGDLRRQLDTQLDSTSHFELKGDKINLSEFTLHYPGKETADPIIYKLMCRCGDYYEVSFM